MTSKPKLLTSIFDESLKIEMNHKLLLTDSLSKSVNSFEPVLFSHFLYRNVEFNQQTKTRGKKFHHTYLCKRGRILPDHIWNWLDREFSGLIIHLIYITDWPFEWAIIISNPNQIYYIGKIMQSLIHLPSKRIIFETEYKNNFDDIKSEIEGMKIEISRSHRYNNVLPCLTTYQNEEQDGKIQAENKWFILYGPVTYEVIRRFLLRNQDYRKMHFLVHIIISYCYGNYTRIPGFSWRDGGKIDKWLNDLNITPLNFIPNVDYGKQ